MKHISTIIGLGLVYIFLYHEYPSYQIILNGKSAHGIVESVEKTKKRTHKKTREYHVSTISYEADGKSYQFKHSSKVYNHFGPKGSSVDVLYDERHPERAMVGGIFSIVKYGFMFCVGISGILMVIRSPKREIIPSPQGPYTMDEVHRLADEGDPIQAALIYKKINNVGFLSAMIYLSKYKKSKS